MKRVLGTPIFLRERGFLESKPPPAPPPLSLASSLGTRARSSIPTVETAGPAMMNKMGTVTVTVKKAVGCSDGRTPAD